MIESQKRGTVMMRMPDVLMVSNEDFVALLSAKLQRQQGLT